LNQNGIESDYNGFCDIIGNGHLILGLEMTSKAITTIHNIELGKPYMFPLGVEILQRITMT